MDIIGLRFPTWHLRSFPLFHVSPSHKIVPPSSAENRFPSDFHVLRRPIIIILRQISYNIQFHNIRNPNQLFKYYFVCLPYGFSYMSCLFSYMSCLFSYMSVYFHICLFIFLWGMSCLFSYMSCLFSYMSVYFLICAVYFHICPVYFHICPVYFPFLFVFLLCAVCVTGLLTEHVIKRKLN